MTGSAVTPAPPAGVSPSTAIGGGGGGGSPKSGPNSSELNSYRISAVIDRLYLHVEGNRNDTTEFVNLCLSLARGIDFAIANNEVPSKSQELPPVIKQVCQTRCEGLLQAAIMVLMISVKGACQSGWFSNRDSEELYNLATKVASTFGSLLDLKTVPNCSSSIISAIMSKFYPRMKIGHIFALHEVKPGFDAYLADFQIPKILKSSPLEKIRLVVVQTDNIETSSCLISPPKVSFLVNGKGVERRTNVSMDNGPQNPTVIVNFLKYGSNLLQAVGEFNGHYLIAVASMTEIPTPDSSALQDYEHHATSNVDSEIIEGPSRISLNCPISRRRIKTPVKGCSCNHIQCFDLDNYVDINSRRPSWRCPSCNQHVCFTDLRIDRKMVKVLQEVSSGISDIIISSDDSWKAVTESADITEKPNAVQTLPVQTQASPAPPNINIHATVSAETPSPMHLESSRNHMSTYIPILAALKANPAAPNIPTTLHAQSPTPVINQSNKNSVNAFIPSSFSPVLQSSPAGSNTSIPLPTNPRHVSQVSLPALHQQHVQQRNQFPPNRPHLQNAGLQNRGQAPNAYWVSTARPGPSPHMANFRAPQSMSQQSSIQSPRDFLPPQSQVNIRGVNVVGPRAPISQHVQLMTAANRTAQMAIDLSRTPTSSVGNNDMPGASSQTINVGSSSQPVTRTDPSNPSDMDWRPAARMRGALMGQAYLDAYNQFIIRPGQQADGARPVPNVTSLPADAQVSMLGSSSSAGMGSRPPGWNISFPDSHPG